MDKKKVIFILIVALFLSVTIYAASKMSNKNTAFQYRSDLNGQDRIRRWISWITPHAKRIGRKHGLPWQALVAQTGWETGWGKSTLIAEAFNFAGIKAVGDQPYVIKRTHEIENGVKVWKDAKFRKFKSIEDGLEEYALFFHKNKRYAKALNYPNDPYRFITEIRNAGYATSLNYISNLHGVLDKYIVGQTIQEYNFEGIDNGLIKIGDKGGLVRELQKKLNSIASTHMIVQIAEDGHFGKKTFALLQRITGLSSIDLEQLNDLKLNDKNCLLCGKPI